MHRCFAGEALALGVILLTTSAHVSLAQETGTPTFEAPYRAFTTYEFGAAVRDGTDAGASLEFVLQRPISL
jgi:hypothetical protein